MGFLDTEFKKKKKEILANHENELKNDRKRVKEIENMSLDDHSPNKDQDPHLTDLMDNIYEVKLRLQNEFEDQLEELKQEIEDQKEKDKSKIQF